jgi:hypothetical protein
LVLSFKSWKLNNGVLTSFCAISRIWSWHSISWLVENCVFSWCTCTPGTRKFDALVIATLALSLWPRQGLVRVRDKREAQEAHLTFSGVQENVREWALTLPSDLPLGS